MPGIDGVRNVHEWMNRRAQAAKQRGDYAAFECWRRAYLNAQAAVWLESKRLTRKGK